MTVVRFSFLDPFGLQVSWRTLVSVAATKAIDAWILFPLEVGIARLLRKDGNIEDSLVARLDDVFGDHSWYEAFYSDGSRDSNRPLQRSLFQEDDEETESVVCKADYSTIETYFKDKLRKIFHGVADNPVQLKNSKNIPLYLLFLSPETKKAIRSPRKSPSGL